MKQQYKDILSNQLEYLSEMEHQQWESWVTGLIKEFGDKLPIDLIKRWEKNIKPYSELDEDVKEKDRKWAKKIILHINNQFNILE